MTCYEFTGWGVCKTDTPYLTPTWGNDATIREAIVTGLIALSDYVRLPFIKLYLCLILGWVFQRVLSYLQNFSLLQPIPRSLSAQLDCSVLRILISCQNAMRTSFPMSNAALTACAAIVVARSLVTSCTPLTATLSATAPVVYEGAIICTVFMELGEPYDAPYCEVEGPSEGCIPSFFNTCDASTVVPVLTAAAAVFTIFFKIFM